MKRSPPRSMKEGLKLVAAFSEITNRHNNAVALREYLAIVDKHIRRKR
jgi:hypothetical protein